MSEIIVKDESNGNTRRCESKAEAQEVKNDLVSLGARPENIVIEMQQTDGDTDTKTESEPNPQSITESEPVGQIDEKQVSEDPVNWMPDHFVDRIQGVPAVNRKGYAVIAEQYGVSVTAEPVTLASETDFEYAEFRAIAEKDGQEYSGFGSAHISRKDGDDAYLLNELAETRAMKRATSWATGIGMTAISEMKGGME